MGHKHGVQYHLVAQAQIAVIKRAGKTDHVLPPLPATPAACLVNASEAVGGFAHVEEVVLA